jgi:hypothetical protein
LGITLDAAIDPETEVVTQTATNVPTLFTFQSTTGATGSVTSLTSSNPRIQTLFNAGILDTALTGLNLATVGMTGTTGTEPLYYKIASNFSGISFTFRVGSVGTSGTLLTGSTSGVTIQYSGTSYTDCENQLVAFIRSRGTINSSTELPAFEVTGSTGVAFDPSYLDATMDAKGDFHLVVTQHYRVYSIITYH